MGGLQYAAFIIPVLLLLVGLEYLVSRRKGVEAYTLGDTIVNICCGILERLFDLFWIVLLYFLFDYLYDLAPWHIPMNAGTWILAFFVADFLAYWHHRLSHQINFMWAAHIVHHQSEELNLTTVFRVSAFAVINRTFFWIWMPFMGFSPEMATASILFIGLYQFVTHTRLVGKLGWLEYLFVTPSHHRVHHARNEKYIDQNYGHVFIIWDRMFGTFKEEEEEPDYGITTGFESANPYRAYFFYWKDLFRRAKGAKRWSDKIKVFLTPPAWNPEGVEHMAGEYQVDKQGKRVKYRVNTPFRLQLYVFLSVLFTVSAFVSMLLIQRGIESPTIPQLISHPTIITLGILVMVSILAHGLLLEQKKFGLMVEYGRLVLISALVPWLAFQTPYPVLLIVISLSFALIQLVWLLRMRNYFTEEKPKPQVAQTA